MNVFFTSDQHIGHEKIAQLRAFTIMPVLPRYVGAEIDWHDRMLARKWDAVVRPADTVWVLGDISAGGTAAQHRALDWFRNRTGRKHLIAGNHDSVHPMHRDSYKWLPQYLDGAFDTVQMAAKRRISLPEGHVTAMLSHFPYRGDHTTRARYPEWRLPDIGHYLLHGHVHSTHRFNGREIHVGPDAWDFEPVPMSAIEEHVRTNRAAPCADVPMFEV